VLRAADFPTGPPRGPDVCGIDEAGRCAVTYTRGNRYAHIVLRGAAWYKGLSLSSPKSTGTKLLSVCGHVQRPRDQWNVPATGTRIEDEQDGRGPSIGGRGTEMPAEAELRLKTGLSSPAGERLLQPSREAASNAVQNPRNGPKEKGKQMRSSAGISAAAS
jgi:hypothetical protein